MEHNLRKKCVINRLKVVCNQLSSGVTAIYTDVLRLDKVDLDRTQLKNYKCIWVTPFHAYILLHTRTISFQALLFPY